MLKQRSVKTTLRKCKDEHAMRMTMNETCAKTIRSELQEQMRR